MGTSSAALTFLTAMTWVTISSEVALTRLGRSIEGICRASASGTIFSMFFPAGTAMKP